MGGPGSGGANRKSLAALHLAGTYRPDRHAGLTPAPPVPLPDADRRAALHGLDPASRRLAKRLLEQFSDWDASSLVTLRSYVLSCQRLAELETANDPDRRPWHRELRTNVMLAKALHLEPPR